jgi:multimeric flavodoxin WrbA
MKILGIVCSSRKGGNTEILMREALEAAQKAGGETELFLIADKDISFCNGCEACVETGKCIIEDDMQELYEKMEAADGIILGTPVYFNSVSAQAKAIMDRGYAFLRVRRLKGKVAAAIAVARRIGAGSTLSLLYSYFTFQRMVIAGGGVGYGLEKGDVLKGVGGSPALSALEEARSVGKGVVRMLKQLSKE